MSRLMFIGRHVRGCGRAHLYLDQHRPFFQCGMVGTFNITLDHPFDNREVPTKRKGIGSEGRVWYHFLRLVSNHDTAYGWSFHWDGSRQKDDVLEVITRQPLPDSFLSGPITVEVLEPWSAEQIKKWAETQYWFQTFPWSPKKADSALVWDAIQNRCLWSGRTVLDIGTHYGYHALRAAREGASVVGFEPEDPSRECAITIDRYIEQQGVPYLPADPGGSFDIILYLSVHHQIDEKYDELGKTLEALRARCEDLFVELILPSSTKEFGGRHSDQDVDEIVAGQPLLTYKHRVRHTRRIYHVRGHQA